MTVDDRHCQSDAWTSFSRTCNAFKRDGRLAVYVGEIQTRYVQELFLVAAARTPDDDYIEGIHIVIRR